MTSQAESRARIAVPDAKRAGSERTQRFFAAGSLLGAVAASSCCLVPLLLFALGVSGAWIGNLTRLALYQPCFLIATAGCVIGGIWLRYRARQACAAGEACARPLPNRVVTIGFILASTLVGVAVALDLVAPLFL